MNQKLRQLYIGMMAAILLLGIGLIGYFLMSGRDFSSHQKKDSYLIGESFMTMNNEFYEILSEELSQRIEAEGDRVVLRDPPLSVERQIEQIEGMLEMGIDVLVLTPVDWDSLTEVLQKAKAQGVRIVVVDSNVSADELVDCTITSDNYQAGYIVGEYFRSTHEEASVLIMTHETAKSGQDRVQGFLDAVAVNPAIRIVEQIECEGQLEIAMPKLQEAIREGLLFDNVFCLNDLASVGVAAALDEDGMLDQVGIYGVDASPDAKALIKEGMMEASAAQFPSKIGEDAAEALYRLLAGEEVDRNIAVPVELVTQENVDQYHVDRWQ